MDKLRLPPGTQDSLGKVARLREHVLAQIRKLYELFGFEPLHTPSIEYADVFDGHHGEGEKLLFHLSDSNGEKLVLRYDLTVPLARVISMHSEIQLPYKRYQFASSFRDDTLDKGHFREFTQCDADIVGADSLDYDSDVITMASTGLNMVGLDNHIIRINHRGLVSALSVLCFGNRKKGQVIQRALDHADKVTRQGLKGIEEDLVSYGIPTDQAKVIARLISIKGKPEEVLSDYRREMGKIKVAKNAINELEYILSGIPQKVASHVCVDLSLARGADYYTGFILEGVIPGSGIGAVLGGGRYDNLTQAFGGRNLMATGMAFGLDRILTILEPTASLALGREGIFLVVYGEEIDRSLKSEICLKLRRNGYAVSTKPNIRSEYDATVYAGRCKADGIIHLMPNGEINIIPRTENVYQHSANIKLLCGC